MARVKANERKEEPRARGRQSPPLYQIVVKALQSEIVRGIYPVGTHLPSEAALVDRFRVSRHTIRGAIRSLRDAGLVSSHQGRGTVVQSPGHSQGYIHHVSTISDLFPVNVETRYQVPNGELRGLPDWVQDLPPSISDRSWLHICGERFRPGETRPMNQVEVFVSARFAGVGRVVNGAAGSIYGMVELIYGETISQVQQIIGAFRADDVRGAALGLPPGETGMEIRRIYRLASDGDIALISFNYYRPEDFSFSMTLSRVKT